MQIFLSRKSPERLQHFSKCTVQNTLNIFLRLLTDLFIFRKFFFPFHSNSCVQTNIQVPVSPKERNKRRRQCNEKKKQQEQNENSKVPKIRKMWVEKHNPLCKYRVQTERCVYVKSGNLSACYSSPSQMSHRFDINWDYI